MRIFRGGKPNDNKTSSLVEAHQIDFWAKVTPRCLSPPLRNNKRKMKGCKDDEINRPEMKKRSMNSKKGLNEIARLKETRQAGDE